MYTKYLTDRKQRLAFIETHKAMEHKKDSEKEYQRTQKLLDSSKTSVKKHFETIAIFTIWLYYMYNIGHPAVPYQYFESSRQEANYFNILFSSYSGTITF